MFILKSAVKFMIEVFPLFVGGFSDIMEEPEINFSFAEAEFWIVFSFRILSAWVLPKIHKYISILKKKDSKRVKNPDY